MSTKLMKRIDLSGWELTVGSFYNKEHDITIHRTWDFNSRKAFWICKQPSFKTEKFCTVFEALTYVNKDRIKN